MTSVRVALPAAPVRVMLGHLTQAQALCEACHTHVGVLMGGGILLGRWCRICLENRAWALDEPTPMARRDAA